MGLFGGQHKPQRSDARKLSSSADVFKSAGKGGFAGAAKAGRTWRDNKSASGSPKGRSK